MYVPGDKYQVFCTAGAGTEHLATYDHWQEAKTLRNETFYSRFDVRAAWVMKHNPSQGTVPKLYGNTMRRTKHEARQA